MKKYALYVLAVLMLFSYLLVLTLPAEPTAPTAGEDEYLAVHFIDVGQADCILLSCGDEYMLIDGGNAADGYAVRSYLEMQVWTSWICWLPPTPTRITSAVFPRY